VKGEEIEDSGTGGRGTEREEVGMQQPLLIIVGKIPSREEVKKLSLGEQKKEKSNWMPITF